MKISFRVFWAVWFCCLVTSSVHARLGDAEHAMASVVQVFAGNPGDRIVNQGSGVVISPTQIISNYHVVAGKTEVKIKCRGNDSKRESYVIIERVDPLRDLALLRSTEPLTPIQIAPQESFNIDDFVHAIGYPLGTRRITNGRIIGLVRQDGFLILQTSAELNHGNSGGALIDEEGRLIGINFRIASVIGKSGTLNEAIHVSEVLDFAQRQNVLGSFPSREHLPCAKSGFPGSSPFRRDPSRSHDGNKWQKEDVDQPPKFLPEPSEYAGPRLGVRLEKCPTVFSTLGNQGMKIVRVDPGGAGERSGLELWDQILTMNDLPIGSASNLIWELDGKKQGERVVFQILRKGLFCEIPVILGGPKKYPKEQALPNNGTLPQDLSIEQCPPQTTGQRMGIVVESWTPKEANTERGLRIVSVAPGGAGCVAKLSEGDVIIAINGEDPGNPYKFVMHLYGIQVGTPVKLKVSRQGQIQEINVVIQGG